MIYISLIYSSATSYLNCFNVQIFTPYAFYLSYCLKMDSFIIKAAFGSEAFIRGRRSAYLRAGAYKKKYGNTEDTHYSW